MKPAASACNPGSDKSTASLWGIRKERQLEGIAKAKAAGVYRGRKATVPVDAVRSLRAEGVSPTEIAKRLGIGRASVYRALGEHKPGAAQGE